MKTLLNFQNIENGFFFISSVVAVLREQITVDEDPVFKINVFEDRACFV